MDPSFIKKLDTIEKRFHELEKLLSNPQTISNQMLFRELSKERSNYVEIVEAYTHYKKILTEVDANEELLKEKDKEIHDLAKAELSMLYTEKEKLEQKIKVLLLPKDPNDEKNILLEIRGGTGGEEASLFAADLFRMYTKYAEKQGWHVEVLSTSWTGLGGLKEVVALVSGQKVYSQLKYESGVHRVQRVPKTEAQGRIHTSAVTVAILPEADEVEVDINPADLRVDVFRSSGPGGQSVNTTDSAVRMTHIPSGLVVSCQDEKSQHKNKAKALKILMARLYDLKRQKQEEEMAKSRKSQIGTGDRSEKIRTYNFPQSRLTDHRIGLTVHNLEEILNGHLDEVITALQNYYQQLTLQFQSTH